MPEYVWFESEGGLSPGSDRVLMVIVTRPPQVPQGEDISTAKDALLEITNHVMVESEASVDIINTTTARRLPKSGAVTDDAGREKRIDIQRLKASPEVWIQRPANQGGSRKHECQVGDIIVLYPGCGIYAIKGGLLVFAQALEVQILEE